jgi:hypothetical protein
MAVERAALPLVSPRGSAVPPSAIPSQRLAPSGVTHTHTHQSGHPQVTPSSLRSWPKIGQRSRGPPGGVTAVPPFQPSPVRGHHRVVPAIRQSKWELPSLRPWPKNGQRSRGPPAGVTTVPPARPDPESAPPHRQTGKEGGFPSISVSVTSARLKLMQAFTQAF